MVCYEKMDNEDCARLRMYGFYPKFPNIKVRKSRINGDISGYGKLRAAT
jgi:hypothetical protein